MHSDLTHSDLMHSDLRFTCLRIGLQGSSQCCRENDSEKLRLCALEYMYMHHKHVRHTHTRVCLFRGLLLKWVYQSVACQRQCRRTIRGTLYCMVCVNSLLWLKVDWSRNTNQTKSYIKWTHTTIAYNRRIHIWLSVIYNGSPYSFLLSECWTRYVQ